MGIRNRISKKDDLETIEQKLMANLRAKSNFKNKGLTQEELGFKLNDVTITQKQKSPKTLQN